MPNQGRPTERQRETFKRVVETVNEESRLYLAALILEDLTLEEVEELTTTVEDWLEQRDT